MIIWIKIDEHNRLSIKIKKSTLFVDCAYLFSGMKQINVRGKNELTQIYKQMHIVHAIRWWDYYLNIEQKGYRLHKILLLLLKMADVVSGRVTLGTQEESMIWINSSKLLNDWKYKIQSPAVRSSQASRQSSSLIAIKNIS